MTDSPIPIESPEFKAWLEHVEREMLPKMESSDISVAIFNSHIDAKLCVEIGAAILYNKPLVLLVLPGEAIPAALERAAAAIVRGHPSNPETQAKLERAFRRIAAMER